MAAQREEPLRLGPVPAAQHPRNGRLEVVVADPARHASEMLEGQDVPFQERFLRLCGERDVKTPDPNTTAVARTATTSASRRRSSRGTRRSPPRPLAPGGCDCGTATSMCRKPSSARRRATYGDTLTSEQPAPCSATSRCHTRRAVCHCLRGTSRSASSHPSITSAYGSIAGRGRRGYDLRGGGTADSSACRTVRRCTR